MINNLDSNAAWATPHMRSINTPAQGWRPTMINGAITATNTRTATASAAVTPMQQSYRPVAVNLRTTPLQSQFAAAALHPATPPYVASSSSSAAAPTPASPAPPSLSTAPQRNNARTQFLQAATSLGLHGWSGSMPQTSDAISDSSSAFAPPIRARFDSPLDGSTGLADFDTWLDSSRRAMQLMHSHNDLHRRLAEVESQIVAHEREQEAADVSSLAAIDRHVSNSWELAQHLSALMSSQSDTPVHMRNPQPSQFHLIARERGETSSNRATGGQFTSAPAQVHPLLRKLLQQPYEQADGQSVNFIQVEPELQADLCSGLESMCTDVAEWNRAKSINHTDTNNVSDPNNDMLLSPPDALAWSSTLQAQQQPMSAVLSSVVSSWARVQRVADGLGSVHSVTKQIHQLERECERYAQQRRIQSITTHKTKQSNNRNG